MAVGNHVLICTPACWSQAAAQAAHKMLSPSSSGAGLRASDAVISSLLEGLVKQVLHCLRVLSGGLKQLLEQATECCCPLLLALVCAPPDAAPLFAQPQHLQHDMSFSQPPGQGHTGASFRPSELLLVNTAAAAGPELVSGTLQLCNVKP